jgi:hypothetical protein
MENERCLPWDRAVSLYPCNTVNQLLIVGSANGNPAIPLLVTFAGPDQAIAILHGLAGESIEEAQGHVDPIRAEHAYCHSWLRSATGQAPSS